MATKGINPNRLPNGWIAQAIGFSPTFLLLGGLGLIATAVWIGLGAAVKRY